MRLVGSAKPGEGHDSAVADRGDRRNARADRLSVEMNSAGTALRQAAAEVWVVQTDIVAERVKQRHVRIDIDVVDPAVDAQGKSLAHVALPRSHVAALITAEFLRQYLLSSLRACRDRQKNPASEQRISGRAIAASETKSG